MPRPRADEVLVRVLRSALCGTDEHILSGIARKKSYRKDRIVLGHAWSGVIVRCGSGVKGYKANDVVSSLDYVFCGRCERCRSGQENICESYKILGMEFQGTHAAYAVLPARTVFKLPPDVGLDEGAIMVDVFGTAYHALRRVFIRKDADIALWGAGPIGLAIGIILRKIYKVRRLRVIEPSAYRRSLAKEVLGACEVSALAAPYDSADLAIEASGTSKAFQNALSSLHRGGVLLAVGLQNGKEAIPAIKLVSREISIVGTLTITRQEVGELAKMFPSLGPRRIITHKYPLDDISKAYKRFRSRKTGAVLLDLASGDRLLV